MRGPMQDLGARPLRSGVMTSLCSVNRATTFFDEDVSAK